MRIIIDGCDGTGKTTLVNKLLEYYKDLRLEKAHLTSNDPKDYDFYYQMLRKNNMVWDRHFLSELIYPDIFGRERQLTELEAKDLCEFALSEGVVLMILTADNSEILTRLNRRGDEDIRVISKVEYANSMFKAYGEKFEIPVFDTSKIPFEEIVGYIDSRTGQELEKMTENDNER